MENKELFEDYEIKGWQPNPRIYQILGASVIVHLLFLVTVSQFNLLQSKVCDSPYVGKVCQVLDAAYLGTVLLGEDNGFTSQDYEKTEIADADITYIDVSREEPPLEYPAGYFAMTNPEFSAFDQTMPTDSNGFPMTSGSPSQLDLNQPQILPQPNNDVANQPLPDTPFSFGDDKPQTVPPPVKSSRVPSYKPPRNNVAKNKQPKVKNDSPDSLPNLDGDETAKNTNGNTNQQVAKNDAANANKTPDENKDQGGTGFNQKPLKDFGKKYGEQILDKKINVDAPYKVEVISKVNSDGKLIDAKMVTANGSDAQMSEVAKEAISAFSDSQLLRPLYDAVKKDSKIKDVYVKITFSQDKDNLQVIIQTQAETEDKAKTISSGLNALLSLTKLTRPGSDEAVLMEKAQLATQGKTFIINFLISNDDKNQMIEKSLKNLKQELEQKKNQQPNSIAVNKDSSPKG